MLFVTCKACGNEIRTGIAIGFAGRPVLGLHDYVCPKCGHEDEYHGNDYHEAREDRAPETPPPS